jgi:hypothetical protein
MQVIDFFVLFKFGYLLETVAIEAGAEAAARQWPADAPSKWYAI